jgi:hypothetical protein
MSVEKYLGPRKLLRPIPGGLSANVGVPVESLLTVVLKYAGPPPGKIPFGCRKLLLVLLKGCLPKKATGRIGPKNWPFGNLKL